MHMLLIYKVATNPLEIKNQFKKAQQFQSQEKIYKKLKIFHKNRKLCAKGYMASTAIPKSHNDIIGSRGAITRTKHTKIENTQK